LAKLTKLSLSFKSSILIAILFFQKQNLKVEDIN